MRDSVNHVELNQTILNVREGICFNWENPRIYITKETIVVLKLQESTKIQQYNTEILEGKHEIQAW
jgi:hypothetical protein